MFENKSTTASFLSNAPGKQQLSYYNLANEIETGVLLKTKKTVEESPT